ncbi:MAG TPA: hypothetical protein DDW98_04895, partial [Gammaproteobacteria bacterium]|nr:hypothetical protein [Gammaproteobacteria bacterium]
LGILPAVNAVRDRLPGKVGRVVRRRLRMLRGERVRGLSDAAAAAHRDINEQVPGFFRSGAYR